MENSYLIGIQNEHIFTVINLSKSSFISMLGKLSNTPSSDKSMNLIFHKIRNQEKFECIKVTLDTDLSEEHLITVLDNPSSISEIKSNGIKIPLTFSEK